MFLAGLGTGICLTLGWAVNRSIRTVRKVENELWERALAHARAVSLEKVADTALLKALELVRSMPEIAIDEEIRKLEERLKDRSVREA